MKRIISVACEYALYALVLPLLTWMLVGSAGSFYKWENVFDDADALSALRLMIIGGFFIASWRIYHLIKNNKI